MSEVATSEKYTVKEDTTVLVALVMVLGSEIAAYDLMSAGRVFLKGKARRHRHQAAEPLWHGERVEVRMRNKTIVIEAQA
mgnify:CR=1 FL=1